MYGTIARMRVKPGAEAELQQQLRDFEQLQVPGFQHSAIYRMDADENEYWMAVIFDSKEAYVANAQSPGQDERYQQMRALLEADPEWHDGEVVLQVSG